MLLRQKKVHDANRIVCDESQKNAAQELKDTLPQSSKTPSSTVPSSSTSVASVKTSRTSKRKRSSSPSVDPKRSRSSNEKDSTCAVQMDGTWQRRGHASHHGVVTAISVDTGKCLDTEVLTNICKGCKAREHMDHSSDAYAKWKLTHVCRVNHTGSAGAMELVGAVRIFSRSEYKHGLKYTKYLGDGDSAAYKKVTEVKPYGPEFPIEKLECVGHVQKRCGTRLRRLKNENKHLKLSDNKGLGGIG